jgi:hypothetical protein
MVNIHKRPLHHVILSEAKNLGSIFGQRCFAALNVKTLHIRGVVIERVDEIRYFYQFTVVAQSSYPLSQSWSDPAKTNHQWNF